MELRREKPNMTRVKGRLRVTPVVGRPSKGSPSSHTNNRPLEGNVPEEMNEEFEEQNEGNIVWKCVIEHSSRWRAGFVSSNTTILFSCCCRGEVGMGSWLGAGHRTVQGNKWAQQLDSGEN